MLKKNVWYLLYNIEWIFFFKSIYLESLFTGFFWIFSFIDSVAGISRHRALK